MTSYLRFTTALALAGLLLLAPAGCDSDDATDTAADTATDTNEGDTGAPDTSDNDTTVADTTADDDTTVADTTADDDTTVADTTADDTDAFVPPACIDLAESTIELPWAIPDEFLSSTPTWNAPEDGCPATVVRSEATPLLSYQFCNNGTATGTYAIEMLPDSDDLGAHLVAYAGDTIPEDVMQCGASDEPFFGLAEVILIVEPGETITIVASLVEADEGTFTIVAGPYDDSDE